jgi:hypothetical protein
VAHKRPPCDSMIDRLMGSPIPGSVTYSAAIESAAALDTSPNLSDFAERVLREANRHHRPPLQQAQRTLRGFLGTPLRSK